MRPTQSQATMNLDSGKTTEFIPDAQRLGLIPARPKSIRAILDHQQSGEDPLAPELVSLLNLDPAYAWIRLRADGSTATTPLMWASRASWWIEPILANRSKQVDRLWRRGVFLRCFVEDYGQRLNLKTNQIRMLGDLGLLLEWRHWMILSPSKPIPITNRGSWNQEDWIVERIRSQPHEIERGLRWAWAWLGRSPWSTRSRSSGSHPVWFQQLVEKADRLTQDGFGCRTATRWEARTSRRLADLLIRHGERSPAPARPSRSLRDQLRIFVSGASHELNNPLAVIHGRAQLIERRAIDPTTRAMAQAILDQSRRSHAILRDLMAIVDPVAPRPRPTDLGQWVQQVESDCRRRAADRGVQVISTYPPALPQFSVDPDLLTVVVSVLVENAIQASSAGQLVQVSLARTETGFEITVEDRGTGLSLDEAQRAFELFSSGRESRRGLGLGLPRVRAISRQLGASLTLKSRVGLGTRIRWSCSAEVLMECPSPTTRRSA